MSTNGYNSQCGLTFYVYPCKISSKFCIENNFILINPLCGFIKIGLIKNYHKLMPAYSACDYLSNCIDFA